MTSNTAELPIENTMDVNSDSWTAALVADAFRSRFLWTAGRKWLEYDAGIWASVSDIHVKEAVREYLHGYWRHLSQDPNIRHEQLKAQLKLTSAKFNKDVFYLLPGLMEVDDKLFDTKETMLCAGNGVIDLTTGNLYEHDPKHYFTRKTKVSYYSGATHPDWEKALEALPDSEERLWLQARFGQAATGYMAPDDTVLFLPGGGRNGKTTITEGVKNALGTYAANIPEAVLLAKEGAHPTELMTLQGVRFALIEELPNGKVLPTKRLKDLTGTPNISARKMYGDYQTFKATHSIVVTTNYLPVVTEVDYATWARLIMLKFPLRFLPSNTPLERDNDRHGDGGLRPRVLHGEAQQEAVLAWVVAGAVKHSERYSRYPKRSEADTKEWRDDADIVGSFLKENTVYDPDGMVSEKELYVIFREFIESRGHKGWNDQTFAGRFTSHPDVTAANVTKTRTRKVGDISRPSTAGLYSPALEPFTAGQVSVWVGLRWRDSAPSYLPVQAVQGFENFSL